MGNNNQTKNVFLWGVFDILHEGHLKLFQEASKLGNLYVIVLPDKRVDENKCVVHDENKRKNNLMKIGYIKDVYIDALPDLKCFDLVPPDIFCFGYDQDMLWQVKLKDYISRRFPLCKFIIMRKYTDIHSSDLKKLLTLCIIHQHPKVLLGMKKRGFGAGRWNGFGGKVSAAETIETAAKREIREEVGIEVKNLNKVGIIDFEFKGNPKILQVHIFKSDNFSGEPKESEEMKPQWFHIDEIPFKEMWSDDIYWMPLFLSGKKFKGKFLFDESDVVLEQELMEVNEI